MKGKFKRSMKSVLCILLIMTLVLSMPFSHLQNVLANENVEPQVSEAMPTQEPVVESPEESTNPSQSKSEDVEAEVVEEDETLRDEVTKYFEMSDGSMKAYVYPQAVHFYKDGEYEEIDNSLELVEAESKEFLEEESKLDEIISERIATEVPSPTEEQVEIEETKVPEIVEETLAPEETLVPEAPEETFDLEETVVPEEISVSEEILPTHDANLENQSDIVVDATEIEEDITEEEIEEETGENIEDSKPQVDTEEPIITEEPVATEALIVTNTPESTEEIIATEEIEATELPVVTEVPEETEIPKQEEKNKDKKDSEKKKNKNRTKPDRKGSYYKNKSNSFTVKLPEDYGTDYTEFADENGFLSFKLLETNKKSIKKEDRKTMAKGDKTVARNVNDKGSYRSIKRNVDLEYDVSGNMLKETIVLNKKTKEDFTFEVKTSAASAILNEDKSITFFDDNNKELYVISAPYMSDAKGVYTTRIEVEFTEDEEGYILTYKPDEEWLYDKEREYPVRIDPTMFKALDVESIKDTYVASFQNDTYPDIMGNMDVLIVGKRSNGHTMRSLIKFNLPSAIGNNDTIIDAKLYLVHYFGVYESEIVDGIQIDVHELTESFIESEIYGIDSPQYDSAIIDYTNVDKDRYFPNTEIPYDSYNITELANKWHMGKANYGLLLKLHDEDYEPQKTGDDKEVYYFAKQSTYYGDITRYVEITYRNTRGLEDYWTYSTHNVGRAGTGYINLYNGNQVFVHDDVSNDRLVGGFTLSHVYNTATAPTQINNLSTNHYGAGWRLNLVQKLKAVSIEGNSAVKYVYTDGDGTQHYFVETDGKIVDEDGLGLTLTELTNSEWDWLIKTKDDTSMMFDYYGYLRRIIDANGNEIQLNYSPIPGVDNYLNDISTSSGAFYDLVYDSDYRLIEIIDKVGRSTEYEYEGNTLTKITYPDGTYTTFKYDGIGRMIRVREPGTSGCNYSHYGRTGAVNIIDYIGKGGASGNRDKFEYDYCQTQITDSDGYVLKYQFDTAGRNTCVYDNKGNICSYSFTKESTDSGDIFSNNKADVEGMGTIYSENLLKNGTFVHNDDYWWYNTVDGTVVQDNVLLSPKSIKITNEEVNNNLIVQNVSNATSGTYTLSAYLKGTVTSGTGGIGVKIVTNNGASAKSEYITETTDTITDNGFVKLSATITLASGDSINRVEAGLYASAGTVYIDSVQLEKGETTGPINLVENGGFEIGSYGFEKSTNALTERKQAAKYEGTYGYQITGVSTNNSSLYQNITISGKKGDAYTYGAWAKALSVEAHGSNKPFAIKLTFNNTDGTTSNKYIEFNTAVNNWQFLNKTVIADKDYNSLKISCEYNKNANTAYFDCLFLYRDTGASYTYDENGNVVSTADYASGKSSFQYSNNTLSKLIDPTGSGYEYYYNSKKNLKGAKDSSGTQTIITNNSKGNPEYVRVASGEDSAAIEDGEIYYIRLKGNGYYLTAKGTAYSSGINGQVFTGDTSQQWKVVQREGGYYTLHPQNAANQCIDVASGYNTEGASVVIYAVSSSGPGANQMFKIEPQNNYTYTLSPKHSTDNKKLTIKAVEGSTDVSLSAGTASDANSWYFENVEDEQVDSVESGKVYRIRIRHSGKYVDVTNSSTVTGTALIQCSLNHGSNQYFCFTKYGDTDYYTIKAVNSGKLLGVSEDYSEAYPACKYLCLAGTTVTDDTLFKLEYDTAGNKGFRIIPKSNTAQGLGVAGALLTDNAEIVFAGLSASNNRYFILEECSKEIKTRAKYTNGNSYLTDIIDARGKTTSYNYNIETDLLDSVTDPNGVVTTYDYNDLNDRLESVNIGNSIVSYTYNTDGSLSTITSPNTTKYKFTYDSFGRTLSTKVNDLTLATYTYRDNYSSLLSRMDYGNGSYRAYSYDELDRIKTENIDGVQAKTYTYDKLGNVSKIYDGFKGVTTSYNYNLSGRITSLKDTSGQRIGYVYDKYNRVTEQRYTKDSKNISTEYIYGDNTATYEKTGLLYKIDYGNSNIRYWYDDLNRRNLVQLNLGGSTSSISYEYADGNTINSTTTLVSKMNVSYFTSPSFSDHHSDSYEYTYDNNGNISSIKLNGTLKETYVYDNLNQLKTVTRAGDVYAYSFDYNGNILSVIKNNSSYEKLCGYTDSRWGDLLTSFNSDTITYDAIGNPLDYRDGMTLSWVNGRRLHTATLASGDMSIYEYDADGYRRCKIVDSYPTYYNYIDGMLMSEKYGNGTIYYLYDENGSIAGLQTVNGTTEKRYLFQKNIQGDVIGIIDQNGLQVAAYTYDEWGKVLSISGSDANGIGTRNPIRYRGYYYDEETGFYYVSSRYYDPETGRWLNADSKMASVGGNILGYNMFTYCFNNPVNLSDPTGHWPRIIKELGARLRHTLRFMYRTTVATFKAIKLSIGIGPGVGFKGGVTVSGVDIKVGASYSHTDSVVLENGKLDFKNSTTEAVSVEIAEVFNVSHFKSIEHSYLDNACNCNVWEDTFGEKQNCLANTCINDAETLIDPLGISCGAFLGFGFEFTFGVNTNTWNEELIDIFNESLDYKGYGE